MKTIRFNIPMFMINVLLINPNGKKIFRKKTEKVNEFITSYINTPEQFEKPSNVLIFSAIKALKEENLINNFSLVLNDNEYRLFQEQALINLRTEKMQGLYMMLVIYNLILSNP